SSTRACGTGLPLTTLRRYSGIWSTLSGVPCASSNTACLAMSLLDTALLQAEAVHHLHHCLDVLHRRSRHDAMPQVEDVARPPASGAQYFVHTLLQNLKRRKQRDGIEVSL